MKLAPKVRKRNDQRVNRDLRRLYCRADWRKIRKLVLDRDRRLCQECKREGKIEFGNEVDHMIPAVERMDLFYELDNLQTLCGPCHSRKTQRGR